MPKHLRNNQKANVSIQTRFSECVQTRASERNRMLTCVQTACQCWIPRASWDQFLYPCIADYYTCSLSSSPHSAMLRSRLPSIALSDHSLINRAAVYDFGWQQPLLSRSKVSQLSMETPLQSGIHRVLPCSVSHLRVLQVSIDEAVSPVVQHDVDLIPLSDPWRHMGTPTPTYKQDVLDLRIGHVLPVRLATCSYLNSKTWQ